jgi:crotonobetainyl-CoA:carnitine CoA-transferase CaiB-like acyl-CoA transferase
VFEDEQVRHLGVAQPVADDAGHQYRLISQPVALTRTPAQIRRPAPGWGEHTREMLAEMGYAADDIERLYEEGVV